MSYVMGVMKGVKYWVIRGKNNNVIKEINNVVICNQ